MSWSANIVACYALEETIKLLKSRNREHECSNTWYDAKGDAYFYEQGREQADGAITGTVYNWSARRVGSVRIEPDGTVKRFPTTDAGLRKAATLTAQARFEKIHVLDNVVNA